MHPSKARRELEGSRRAAWWKEEERGGGGRERRGRKRGGGEGVEVGGRKRGGEGREREGGREEPRGSDACTHMCCYMWLIICTCTCRTHAVHMQTDGRSLLAYLAILLNFIQSRRRACPTASSGKASVSITGDAGKGDEREETCSEKFSQCNFTCDG